MLYVVKGMFTMVVEADGAPEARRTAERILRNDGVKVFVLDAAEEEKRVRPS